MSVSHIIINEGPHHEDNQFNNSTQLHSLMFVHLFTAISIVKILYHMITNVLDRMLMYLERVPDVVLLCAVVCTVTHNRCNQLSLTQISTKVPHTLMKRNLQNVHAHTDPDASHWQATHPHNTHECKHTKGTETPAHVHNGTHLTPIHANPPTYPGSRTLSVTHTYKPQMVVKSLHDVNARHRVGVVFTGLLNIPELKC